VLVKFKALLMTKLSIIRLWFRRC